MVRPSNGRGRRGRPVTRGLGGSALGTHSRQRPLLPRVDGLGDCSARLLDVVGVPGLGRNSRISPVPSRRKRARWILARQQRRYVAGICPPPLPYDGVPRLSAEYVVALKAAHRGRSYFGPPDCICSYCDALFWYEERCTSQSVFTERTIAYNRCCRAGKICLPKQQPWPSPLRELMRFNGGPQSREFMRLIRSYNAMFAFTSLGVDIDRSINTGDGPYVFRINGVVHHRIGSMLPCNGQQPQFAQLYICDALSEVRKRLDIFDAAGDGGGSADPAIVAALICMLDRYNPLVKKFRMARDRLLSPMAPNIAIRIVGSDSNDPAEYSPPMAAELAALIVGDLNVERYKFDIVVQAVDGPLKQVSHLHPALMALQYPLLFPHGDKGFFLGMKYRVLDGEAVSGRDDVSMLEYYCYHCHYRKNHNNPYICCGRLSEQAKVNAYSCVESSRLNYIVLNQDNLRSESFQGISDAIGQGSASGKNIGIKVLLPSSFTGSRRYMAQNYQDAMAICRAFGAPDLFITFTCNPKWDEIIEALHDEPGQQPADRPDIVSRVFKMKLNQMFGEIKDGSAFGKVNAALYTVEFQKRGLPHAHMLVWLAEHLDVSSEFIDTIISAELPDVSSDPLGYALVDEFMIHGPCGVMNSNCPCMKNGFCSKRFPKSYNNTTYIDDSGFPIYRRRDDVCFVQKGGHRLNNRWVVPYNMHLLKKYQAHINVEWCNKTNLVKYLFKYVTKGHDRTKMYLQNRATQTSSQNAVSGVDEVEDYINCRYLSSCEAVWRLFAFDIHVRTPSVERLEIHLPGMNRVVYHEEADLNDIVTNDNLRKTTLTEWFSINSCNPEARDLTYCEFPTRFTWYPDLKMWKKRKRSSKLGRIRYVHPTTGELFYMRMLLMAVRGACSYEDLRSYQGVTFGTFREACYARGLLGDDLEWFSVFDETVIWATAHQLRHLFVIVLMFCDVGDVRKLYNTYWRYMTHDIVHKMQQTLHNRSYIMPDSYLHSRLFKELEAIFSNNGVSIRAFNLPIPSDSENSGTSNRLVLEETSYDAGALLIEWDSLHAALNTEQKVIYDVIIDAVHNRKPGAFFISGYGGTGKTFLWRTIIARLRSQGRIVLAVASSGVAALLLPGGRTAHSRFRIPVEIDETCLCDIHRGTMLADLLKRTSLILWDEAPMTQRKCFEALDRSLKDLFAEDAGHRSALPFGGLPVVLGGDFRQVLPVIHGASRTQIVNASLIRSPIWHHVKVLTLRTNMRLNAAGLDNFQKREITDFALWVLSIGDGTAPTQKHGDDNELNWIEVPRKFLLKVNGDKIKAIVTEIYNDFNTNFSDFRYLTDRAIVCPTNSVVDEINDYVVNMVPTEPREYLSYDKVLPSSEQIPNIDIMYPLEFLNSITVPNYPKHRLVLKVGVPIILLRNLNPSMGLCNGTRMVVTRLYDHVLEAIVMTGLAARQSVCIPRIVLNASNSKWPFVLQRRQFPVRVCYAMTINKSQGQTLQRVGLYLKNRTDSYMLRFHVLLHQKD